uniref:Uncharacterized protein n=1 Tax=Anopheles merus TaxID=30066 RepID=A0A182VCX5_ANOME
MVAAGTKQEQSRIGQLRRLLLPLLYQITSHYQMMKIGALVSSTVGLWWQSIRPLFIYHIRPPYLKVAVQDQFCVALSAGTTAPVIALLKHIVCRRVQHPVATFAACSCITTTAFTTVPVGRLALATGSGRFFPRYLNETVVQREIVPDGVLPALAIFAIEKGGFSGRWTDFRNENGSDQLFSPKYDWPSVAALCSGWGR